VGMNPELRAKEAERLRVPHMRGDEPGLSGSFFMAHESSPHAWG